MDEINLGSIKIPINAATKTFAILAKRGAGKTYTGAVMAAQFDSGGEQVAMGQPRNMKYKTRRHVTLTQAQLDALMERDAKVCELLDKIGAYLGELNGTAIGSIPEVRELVELYADRLNLFLSRDD